MFEFDSTLLKCGDEWSTVTQDISLQNMQLPVRMYSQQELRCVIRFLTAKKCSTLEIHKMLVPVYRATPRSEDNRYRNFSRIGPFSNFI